MVVVGGGGGARLRDDTSMINLGGAEARCIDSQR